MRTNALLIKFLLPLFIVFGILSSIIALGQKTGVLVADSTAEEIQPIKISEISIKSGEVWTSTSRLYESLLPDEDIANMKVKNDSLIDLIDKLLKADVAIDLNSKNIRYLNNKMAFWTKYSDILDVENTTHSSNIKTLNDYKHDFEDEILVWEKTKSAVKKEDADPTVINRVVELISQMDGVVDKVQKKSDKLLTMLDRTTEEGVVLVEYMDRIQKVLLSKKSEIFEQDQSLVFSVNFLDSNNWRMKTPLMFFYKMEVVELWKYIVDYYIYFIFQIIIIIALILLFSLVKKRMLSRDLSRDTIYERMLIKIFSRNISAALILGLFASVLIFPNRPVLFRDIIVLVVTFPLVLIATTFIERKFFKYLYLFGVLIYLRLSYTIFPPDNLYSTISMLIVAFIEIFILWKLMVYFYKNSISRKLLNFLLLLLIVINLGFAVVGLIAVISGYTILAEITLGVPIVNVLGGILVFTTAIILNGLIDVVMESPQFRKLNFVRYYGDYIRKRAVGLINFTAITYWLYTMMDNINIAEPTINKITSVFTNEIKINSASFTLWDITIFFLVIWLSIILSKMIRILLEEDILNKVGLAKGVPHTIAMMVRYSMITIGVVLAVTAAGVPVDNLTVLIGAFGVGIGFGLQNIFNNLVSGFILLFERPIQIGDTIEVGPLSLTGIVKSIGIRSSNVRTFDGAEVIVPNGQLISNEVVNWTLSDRRRRIEIIAGVAYGSDPHKVRELLLMIIDNHPDIIKDPEPIVLFNALGESSLDFRMLFWTANSSEWITIRSEIMFLVHDVLQKEGISIPFPQMDIHMRSVEKGIEPGNNKK